MITNTTSVHNTRKCIVAAEMKGERIQGVNYDGYFSSIYTLDQCLLSLFLPTKPMSFPPVDSFIVCTKKKSDWMVFILTDILPRKEFFPVIATHFACYKCAMRSKIATSTTKQMERNTE